MSVKASNWAWEKVLPPSSKLILMALADSADDDGKCWPGLRLIARKACVSERTVQRALKDFQEAGLVVVSPRFNGEGRQSSNTYRLCLGPTPTNCHPPPADDTPRVTEPCRPRGDTAVSGQEPSLKRLDESSLLRVGGRIYAFRSRKRVTYQESVSLAAMVSAVPHGAIQDLLDELVGAMEKKVIKSTPVQWFAALVERYRQGRFRASLGINVKKERDDIERRVVGAAQVPAARSSMSAEHREMLARSKANILANPVRGSG